VKEVIIARYGEVHLKGHNRGGFLRALTRNISAGVGQRCKIELDESRYIFSDFKSETTSFLLNRISKVFGLTSVSPCVEVAHGEILEYLETVKISASFKCTVNRADKTFSHTSTEFGAIAGKVLLDANPSAKVDIKSPDTTVFIDIRPNDRAFIYDTVIPAAGGLPVGTAGRALVLLSGGIDSPVAAYLSAKRGLFVDCIHFASPPYTSEFALDKIRRLREKLVEYCGDIRVWVVPFTGIQNEIRRACSDEYMITLMRRFMVRIAREIALKNSCECIVAGENLSQVASQTVRGIATCNICAGEVPILRPVITFDKSEIVSMSKKIGTYEISIEPHADCCTVFVPKRPVLSPTAARCSSEEEKLDVDGLVSRAVEGAYLL
jgi:thiamine biosynthesis protein ThiI